MTTIILSASPLSCVPPTPFQERPDYLSAYNLALKAERHADEQVRDNPSNQQTKDNLISARVAGYLLLELFNRRGVLSEGPCASFAKQLNSPSLEGKSGIQLVFELGEYYRRHLLRLFRTTTTKYPAPSSHPSRHSFGTLEDMIRDCMEADGKDYRTARSKALARDGFRCMVTGLFDRTSMEKSPALKQLCVDLGATYTAVHARHILSESTMQGVDPAGDSEKAATVNKTEHAVTAMAVLSHFGLENLVSDLLAKDGVHDTGNLLSLEPNIHIRFDRLNLWFEGTEEPDCYEVCVPDPLSKIYLRRSDYGRLRDDGNHLYVTFSSNNQKARLPNPKLLALHAACARVAHMSGAAEACDELERDVEETRVLAFDGSSARLLDHLMSPFMMISGVAGHHDIYVK